jgi:hypothetical protein
MKEANYSHSLSLSLSEIKKKGQLVGKVQKHLKNLHLQKKKMKGKLKLTKDHPPSPSKEGKRGFNFNFIIIILKRLLKKKKR